MAAPAHAPRVLDSRLLAAARSLELAARQLAAGGLTGSHRSRQAGLDREFSQYRAYQPGDEPRHIDWKLYARSDRFFLRESEIESRLSVRLIVDATGSMQQSAEAEPAFTKYTAACQLAAALALVAQNQGDAVGLCVLTGEGPRSVTAGGRTPPFTRVVRLLAAVTPGGAWPSDGRNLAAALGATRSSAPVGTTGEITVVFTDGHEQDAEIRAALNPLRSRRNELILFHLIAPEEESFPYRGRVRFEEWETGRVVEADAGRVRDAYFAMREAQVRAWKQAWPAQRFAYVPVKLGDRLDHALRRSLLRLARL
jgi:uncharacterized protein (DUF58 family)